MWGTPEADAPSSLEEARKISFDAALVSPDALAASLGGAVLIALGVLLIPTLMVLCTTQETRYEKLSEPETSSQTSSQRLPAPRTLPAPKQEAKRDPGVIDLELGPQGHKEQVRFRITLSWILARPYHSFKALLVLGTFALHIFVTAVLVHYASLNMTNEIVTASAAFSMALVLGPLVSMYLNMRRYLRITRGAGDAA